MGKAFDIDFKLLPPKLWVLALDANTSKVNIAYRPRELSHRSGIQLRRQCGSFSKCPPLFNDGWRQPFKRGRQPGIVFRGFRFAASANVTRESTGVSIGYGASLLPFPMELSNTFNSAAIGLQSMAKDIG
jgi:hypothetical protein